VVDFSQKYIYFFSTLFGTSFFFFLTSWMASGIFSDELKFYCYLFLTVGAVYLLMRLLFSKKGQNEYFSLRGFFMALAVYSFWVQRLRWVAGVPIKISSGS